MYCEHFGLRQFPFALTPNTTNFFRGGNRGLILESLRYALKRGDGMLKVVGEVGSGKTMLCRMLESQLPPDYDSVYLDNPGLDPDDLLNAIALELGLPTAEASSRLPVLNIIKQELIARYARGRRVVLLVEEAQNMSLESMEEMRLLSNLETRDCKLLQIILFGQPELDDLLSRQQIRQLRDRIVHSFYLNPLNASQVNDYLMHRLFAAGYTGPDIFSRGAIRRLTRASGGLMRKLNVIADKSLLSAYMNSSFVVRSTHIRRAAKDNRMPTARTVRIPLLKLFFVLAISVAVLLVWGQSDVLERYVDSLAPDKKLMSGLYGCPPAATIPVSEQETNFV